ncbi:MAG: glycosyltransferase family 10 [Methanoregulaceae archaeon]|nr:glycosyltransferase family 10 [Methanoregulaceae archaeon]
MRQSPGCKGIWGDIRFTTHPLKECDYVVVLNVIPEPAVVFCPPENVWAVMQEPYIKGVFEWMVRGHSQYSKVFTHHVFSDDQRYIPSQPCLPWHVNRTFDELTAATIPGKKAKTASWISSDMTLFPGHVKRMEFLRALKQSLLETDFFGRGINFVEDKWDALAPYKYSFAVENSSSKDYWTEKVGDCFLCFTLPIYYGCTNLEDYFPQESFIRINIENPGEALRIAEEAVAGKEWEKRLDAIAEARRLLLNKYQLFPFISKRIKEDKGPHLPEELRLDAYRDRFFKRIKDGVYFIARWAFRRRLA